MSGYIGIYVSEWCVPQLLSCYLPGDSYHRGIRKPPCLPWLHTQGSLQSWICVVWRLWLKAAVSDDWVQCLLLDGWQLGSEVHFPFSSVTLSGLAFRGSKKGFDEKDSEVPRHLAAVAALPSTSWGPAELLCGSQRRETRCTLWSKHRLRGAVQVTPSVGACHRRSVWGGEGWRRGDVVQL